MHEKVFGNTFWRYFHFKKFPAVLFGDVFKRENHNQGFLVILLQQIRRRNGFSGDYVSLAPYFSASSIALRLLF
jgi:hypothetical protein